MKIFGENEDPVFRGRALLKDFVVGDNLFYGSPDTSIRLLTNRWMDIFSFYIKQYFLTAEGLKIFGQQ